ncbi:MAG: hypothetical protein LH649_03495, partial [Pseudanabaena sp. CAN_BIN31]|nr:hypothetical protein [Pseudanabaena sp. CAN_BIN31]
FLALSPLAQPSVAQSVNESVTTQPSVTKKVSVEKVSVEKVSNQEPATVNDLLKASSKSSDLAIDKKLTPTQPVLAQADETKTSPEASSKEPDPSFGSSFTIIPQIGTLGFGLGVATPITSDLQARVGLNYAGFGITTKTNDINLDANLNLFSVSALVDYYPFGAGSFFGITGGLVYQTNRLEGKATGNSITVNGTAYPLTPADRVDGTFSFPNNIAPYVGITFGNSFGNKGGLGFFSSVGVLFSGTPKADITASGPILGNNAFKSDLNKEISRAQDEVNKNVPGIYPVLSFGLTYQF